MIWRRGGSLAPAGHQITIPSLSSPLSGHCTNYTILAHTEKMRKINNVMRNVIERSQLEDQIRYVGTNIHTSGVGVHTGLLLLKDRDWCWTVVYVVMNLQVT